MTSNEYHERYEFTRDQLTAWLQRARQGWATGAIMWELDDEKKRYEQGEPCLDARQCLPPRRLVGTERYGMTSLPDGVPERPGLSMRLLQPDGQQHVRALGVRLYAYEGGPVLADSWLVVDWADALYTFAGWTEWKSLYEGDELLDYQTMAERWAEEKKV